VNRPCPPPPASREQAAGRPPRGGSCAVVLVAVVAAPACIIPDAGIVVEDEFVDVGAVRIVEPTPITARADADCDERTPLSGCPKLNDTLPSGLIRPESPLCVCPGDDLGVGGFEIFVEDPDIDDEGDPKDELLGALFLDMPADAEDPRDSLAYINQLPPEEPARRFRASDLQTIERPDPHLKAWTIAGQGRLDLCNDNDGAKVEPGLHELRLVVTDRPWYRPLMVDAMGEPILDEDGELTYDDPVFGMPDLRAGATYDTTTYVFECYDSNGPPMGIECSCE
jgi:hypothetical protein